VPSNSVWSPLLRATRAIGVALLLVIALLAAAELGLRGLYAYGRHRSETTPLLYERVYWAVPPWAQYDSLMYDDPELGLWMRPHAARTYVNLFGPIGDVADVGGMFESLFPTLPEWARQRPVWHLRTNGLGLRGDEIQADKPAGTFRVVVLGDSWTVGINVEREDSYVAQLADLLAQMAAPRRTEVLNFGVIGGRAETGRRLLGRVLALHPDLVVVAYAQNDEESVRDARAQPARSPATATDSAPARPAPFRWQALLSRFELYDLVQWWQTPHEDRIEATLRHELTRQRLMPKNAPGRSCPNPRVAATPYFAAVDEIVRTLGDAGIATILLYNNVPDFLSHCTLGALTQIAAQRGVALVDSSATLEALEQREDAELETRHGLEPSDVPTRTKHSTVDAVFRVDMSSEPSGRRAYVMGNDPVLGGFVPNTMPLYDDGTHGDQRAGDGVWSRTFSFDGSRLLTYAFSDGSERGAWQGLENYRLRAIALRPADLGRVVYLPIAQFGRQPLRSDSSHPDAEGHRAIAQTLADAVRTSKPFVAFTARADAPSEVPAVAPSGTPAGR
jgi:lysophospholipase L1-like esterase